MNCCGFVSLFSPPWIEKHGPLHTGKPGLINQRCEWVSQSTQWWGRNGPESVHTYFHNLVWTSCSITDNCFPFNHLLMGNCPLALECAAFVRNLTACEMLLPLLPKCLLTLFFVFTFFEVESMAFPEQCVSLEQISCGMRDFCFEVTWRKISFFLTPWAPITLLAGVFCWWEVLPKQTWEIAAACWFKRNAIPVLSSSHSVPEGGLHLILCNSYWSLQGSWIKLCLEMQSNCINLYLRETEREGEAA